MIKFKYYHLKIKNFKLTSYYIRDSGNEDDKAMIDLWKGKMALTPESDK